ncbi:glycosyltransferase [Vibrio cyclitrophicus]|uniref:glycosyltransferase n=1 Tax=Vibrio cyclitrophicus TaxID=47951 RepID=UPI00035EBEF5|nr:glycosyltransferase [Vibrio cyclitrophicus]OEE10480.1 hypothetical protein OC1_16720 [Vibrio cyclitrophicus ZF207]
MKKLLFVDSYYNDLYGAQKSMLKLAQLVDGREFKSTIATFHSGKLMDEVKRSGINSLDLNTFLPLLDCKTNTFMSKLKLLFLLFFHWLFFFSRLYKQLNDYDVVCVNDIRTVIYLLPIIITRRNSIKFIWYIRIRENLTMVKFLSKFFKEIVVNSSKIYNIYESQICKGKLHLVYTGFEFNSEIKDLPNIFTRRLRVICLASINNRKNQIESLQIVSQLSNKYKIEIDLDFCGDFSEDEVYFLQLKKLINLKENDSVFCKFLGYRDDVVDFLSEYDISILSSKREGLPRSLIESASQGLYLISSDVEGSEDIITNDHIGVIYSPSDIEKKTVSVNFDFLNDHYRHMRKNAMKNCFSNKKFKNEFLKVIN